MTFIPPALAAPALPRPSSDAVRAQVPVTATSSTDGTATFTFPDCPQGQWQVGAVTIAGAPVGAQLAAVVGLQPWGVWNGPAPSPVIQIDGRTHLVVSAQFLAPNTTYTAWFVGWSDSIDALVFPFSASSSLPAFSSTSLQPQTTTTTIAPVTFGPYSVGAMAGMRFSLVAEALFSNCVVDLRWYDSEAIANAPGLYDAAGIFDFTVLTGQRASFVIPHMADWLVVTIQSADAGQTKPHWSMANRQAGFDMFGQGLGTGNANVDVPIGTFGVIAGPPPANGPWYRVRAVTVRANGTPTAGALPTIGLSDDGVTAKSWLAIQRATATASEVYFGDFICDVTIANPTRIYFNNNTGVDCRAGCTWEVVPPMFVFPRDT